MRIKYLKFRLHCYLIQFKILLHIFRCCLIFTKCDFSLKKIIGLYLKCKIKAFDVISIKLCCQNNFIHKYFNSLILAILFSNAATIDAVNKMERALSQMTASTKARPSTNLRLMDLKMPLFSSAADTRKVPDGLVCVLVLVNVHKYFNIKQWKDSC